MADSAQQPSILDGQWRAQHLQLISFPQESQLAVEQNWWADLTGNSEVESTRKKGARTDSGAFDGNALQLNIDLLRTLWIMSPILDLTNAERPEGPPEIGDFASCRDKFSQLMEHWLTEFCPPINRLAFAATLIQWTNSREESYKLLDRYLPVVEVDPESTDFQYRINRKRTSTTDVSGLVVNRLSTWASIKVSIGGMRVVMAGGATATANTAEGEFTGCQLQLDINTEPNREGQLPHNRLPQIWRELVALGSEIASRGDIR